MLTINCLSKLINHNEYKKYLNTQSILFTKKQLQYSRFILAYIQKAEIYICLNKITSPHSSPLGEDAVMYKPPLTPPKGEN